MATKIKHASFKVSKKDAVVIDRIAYRAVTYYSGRGIGDVTIEDISMDITACHANGCNLRLYDLLAADDFNFLHDIAGINRHLDRTTGQLMNCYVPRFRDWKPAERKRLAKAIG